MAEITVEELQEVKKTIERSKTKLSELKGEEKTHLANLVKECEVKDIAAAEKKVEKLQEEIDKIEEQIAEKEEAIIEEFPQLFE